MPPSQTAATSVSIGNLRISLLLLRVGVFLVMLIWTFDKFIQPEHQATVFKNFYFIDKASPMFLKVIGVTQLAIVLAFAAGFAKPVSYGLVLAMHTVSTFASWKQYLAPFSNLMFFAAWPMLSACVALFLMREHDTLFSADAACPLTEAKADYNAAEGSSNLHKGKSGTASGRHQHQKAR